MSTSSVCHFGTEIDMDLRFFALVHKYSLILESIKIEKVIFFRFFWGGGSPLKGVVPHLEAIFHIFKTLIFKMFDLFLIKIFLQNLKILTLSNFAKFLKNIWNALFFIFPI